MIIEDLVVLMHDDDAGQFLGGEALPETETPRYVAARDALWAAVRAVVGGPPAVPSLRRIGGVSPKGVS